MSPWMTITISPALGWGMNRVTSKSLWPLVPEHEKSFRDKYLNNSHASDFIVKQRVQIFLGFFSPPVLQKRFSWREMKCDMSKVLSVGLFFMQANAQYLFSLFYWNLTSQLQHVLCRLKWKLKLYLPLFPDKSWETQRPQYHGRVLLFFFKKATLPKWFGRSWIEENAAKCHYLQSWSSLHWSEADLRDIMQLPSLAKCIIKDSSLKNLKLLPGL